MLLFCILFLIVCENVFSFYIPGGNHTEIILTNFSFGSCFGGFLSDSEKQWIFRTIEKQNPQIWIWAGDAAYLDSFSINYFKRSINLNFTHAEKMFNKTKFNEYYQILHKRIPTIGVWDDHDFGFNDGNKYYLDKEYIKKLYLDFIDESNDSIRRSLKRGIFTSYSFGDPTTHKTVKIILLDVRYDKNSLVFDNSPDMLGIVALYLGEEQWVWLENELMTNETFTFIVSGTQILPFNRLVTESWYGNSRKRLFSLIEKTQKNGVILLSGDIHSGQFLKTPCVLKEIGYTLNEITSSGLTHYCSLFCKITFDYILPNDYQFLHTVVDYNFGMLEFNWGSTRNESSVTTKIIDIDGVVRLQNNIPYNELIYNSYKGNEECSVKLNRRFKTIKEYYSYYRNQPTQVIVIIVYICFILLILFILSIVYKLFKIILIVIFSILRKASNYVIQKMINRKEKEV